MSICIIFIIYVKGATEEIICKTIFRSHAKNWNFQKLFPELIKSDLVGRCPISVFNTNKETNKIPFKGEIFKFNKEVGWSSVSSYRSYN